MQTSGAMRRENAKLYPPSLRGANATKQSMPPPSRGMDCFAPLAMTWMGRRMLDTPHVWDMPTR